MVVSDNLIQAFFKTTIFDRQYLDQIDGQFLDQFLAPQKGHLGPETACQYVSFLQLKNDKKGTCTPCGERQTRNAFRKIGPETSCQHGPETDLTTTCCAYIYIYIYICCEVTNWATFGHF